MHRTVRTFAFAAAILCAAPAWSQVVAKNAWVRATVQGQLATGAFMQLNAPAGGKVVEARSAAAGVVELHEMTMEGTTMRMRAVPAIVLAPGQTVELKPGGLHLMLMGLKEPLTAGDTVALTLVVETPDRKRETVEVKAAVRAPGAPGAKH